jgi:hypothetical protein
MLPCVSFSVFITMIYLIIRLSNIRQISLIMYTYNRNDLQIIEEKQIASSC